VYAGPSGPWRSSVENSADDGAPVGLRLRLVGLHRSLLDLDRRRSDPRGLPRSSTVPDVNAGSGTLLVFAAHRLFRCRPGVESRVRRHCWRVPRGPAASRRCSRRFTVRSRAPWLVWGLVSPMAPHHCGATLDLPSIDLLPSVYSRRFDPPSVGGQPWPPIAFRPRGLAPPRRFPPLDPRQIPIR